MVYFGMFFLLVFLVDMAGGSKILNLYFKGVRLSIKNVYILLFLGMLILIGIRDMSVGTDTMMYVYDFLSSNEVKWTKIMSVLFEYSEPLFFITKVICRTFTDNYTLFLLICGFPISIFFSLYLKYYSDDYMLSTLIFIVLGILGFCMAGMRQSIALGISLIAYKFARDRRLIPFLLCCLAAFGYHNSSLVLLVIYPLFTFKRIGFKWWIIILIAFLIGYSRNGIVLKIASLFFTQNRYDMYLGTYTSSLNYTMLIIQGGLLLFCYLNRNYILEENKKNISLFIMAFIGMIFQSFTPILGEFFRLSMYFSVSLCILVPKAIALIPNSNQRTILFFGMNFLFIAYILVSRTNIFHSYIPFWL